MNFVTSLGLILLGLVIGQTVKKLVELKVIKESFPIKRLIKLLQNIALLGLSPLVTLGAFWVVRLSDARLIALPVLGVAALIIGGIFSFFGARLLKLDRKQQGSMIVSGSFSNLGSFGSLICYVLLGESSYAYVAMYRLFEHLVYHTIGFPVAKLHGDDFSSNEQNGGLKALKKVLTDPYIIVSLLSIIIGSLLNISGLQRPAFYKNLNDIFIPTVSVILVTTVGFNMRLGAVNKYLRECIVVSVIKYVMVPVIIIGISYLLGLHTIEDGMVFKVIIILSAMPTAFNALVPPQIYGLDTDLANSCWIFTTGVLVLFMPIFYLLV